MSQAAAAGLTAVGVDVNATSRSIVAARGMRCESTIPCLSLPARSNAAVGFIQSLEHLTEPFEVLSEAAALLRADG